MEHVLCILMAFADEPDAAPDGHMVYLCTCEEMQSTVDTVVSLGVAARGTFAGVFSDVPSCIRYATSFMHCLASMLRTLLCCRVPAAHEALHTC